MFDDLRNGHLYSFGVGRSARDGDQASATTMSELPFLEAESPATTGIEAPVATQHLTAHSHMSVIVLGVEELTNCGTNRS